MQFSEIFLKLFIILVYSNLINFKTKSFQCAKINWQTNWKHNPKKLQDFIAIQRQIISIFGFSKKKGWSSEASIKFLQDKLKTIFSSLPFKPI